MKFASISDDTLVQVWSYDETTKQVLVIRANKAHLHRWNTNQFVAFQTTY